MKKKGFTLIELLAVIVILAIIALIATPIVMNVIENSRKGAAERSAENYLHAVETAVMEKRIDGEMLSDGKYDLATLESKLGTIAVNGQSPTEATIIIKEGKVIDGSIIIFNNYVINIIEGLAKTGDFGTVLDLFATTETEVSNFIKNQSTDAPTLTYNPITGEKGCTQDDTSCFGWYVLEDKGNEYANVTLIMDRNLGDNKVAWCGDETLCKKDGNWNNLVGPLTAMNYLKTNTSSWVVPVGMPSIEQITLASGSVFVEAEYVTVPEWLVTNLNPSGSPKIYWTSSKSTTFTGQAYAVWANNSSNTTSWKSINNSTINYGVRPVITVAKTQL